MKSKCHFFLIFVKVLFWKINSLVLSVLSCAQPSNFFSHCISSLSAPPLLPLVHRRREGTLVFVEIAEVWPFYSFFYLFSYFNCTFPLFFFLPHIHALIHWVWTMFNILLNSSMLLVFFISVFLIWTITMSYCVRVLFSPFFLMCCWEGCQIWIHRCPFFMEILSRSDLVLDLCLVISFFLLLFPCRGGFVWLDDVCLLVYVVVFVEFGTRTQPDSNFMGLTSIPSGGLLILTW